MFWKVQEILCLIGTEISQIGQREAVRNEIEDFNFKSKSGLFYQLFVCMRWVGIFEPLFLIHFLTKILSFVTIGKEISWTIQN